MTDLKFKIWATVQLLLIASWLVPIIKGIGPFEYPATLVTIPSAVWMLVGILVLVWGGFNS